MPQPGRVHDGEWSCVLILDKETARTWELYQGEINETSEILDEVTA
jgi:hypothetical protein